MAGHHRFIELIGGLSAERQARIAEKVDALREQVQQEDRDVGAKPRRQFGAFAGQFSIGPEFFEPMSVEDRRAWGED